MWTLRLRMYLLMILMFAIVYAVVSMVAYGFFGVTDFNFYLIFSLVMMVFQYMIGPKLVEWTMRVRYVTAGEYPELQHMVENLSRQANIPKPRVGIAQIPLPNAFA